MNNLRIIMTAAMLTVAALLPPQGADARTTRSHQLSERPVISAMARSGAAEAWADSVMAHLSLRERVAQLVVPRLDVTDTQAGRAAVRRMVAEQHVGGLLFGKGTLADYIGLIRYAQSQAQVPLMITLDGEWGLNMRITDAPRMPYNMALGASRDDEVFEAYGEEVARQCRLAGIHVNFAPVLDVNSNPRNPVIGFRSFGEDPARVARAGVAYSRGLERGGVLSVAKHFPGHGDTSTDSHKTLPTVSHSRETLDKVDLLPFRRYIDADLGGVMVGHLNVPALDRTGTPASLSHQVTTGLLRNEMKFKGLVFTDALAMAGAASGTNNCVAALEAGTDILLQPKSPAADIDAVVKAVESGRISREVIDERCRKVLSYKYALGLAHPVAETDIQHTAAAVKGPEADAASARLERASLTLIFNHHDLLPLRDLSSRTIAVVSVGAPASNEFSSVCADYAPVTQFAVDQNSGATTALLNKLHDDYDVVIVGVFADKAWAREAVGRISSHTDRMVGVFFMNPYKMASFGGGLSDIAALVLTGDDTPGMRRAAAEGVFGGCAMDGRLPVELPTIARLGTGKSTEKVRLGSAFPQDAGFDPSLTRRIDSVMRSAVRDGLIPGGQVVVVKGGDVVHRGAYGKTDPAGRETVTDSTIYDLASVTKPIATLSGLMKAYGEGLFKLDDLISHTVTGLRGTDKEKMTYSDALYHTSGMPAMISVVGMLSERDASGRRRMHPEFVATRPSDAYPLPFAEGLWLQESVPDTLMQRIYDAKLKTPGRYLYSDLNFCLLREAEERLTEVPHDEWVATEIFGPLGASTLGYNPLNYYPKRHIAPTEYDADFRRQKVHGYVHDETAAASGGVQGNAGLFGSALDVAKVCRMWLQEGSYGGEQILSSDAVCRFLSPSSRRTVTTAKGKSSLRGPGVAYVDEDSPAPSSTYGHTGFTGTCFWVDPENEIIYVFLSNRVCPSRKTPDFFRDDPRTAVMKVIYESLNDSNNH